MNILIEDAILLNAKAFDKWDAIKTAGSLLVKSGCVEAGYIDGMLERETTVSTYLDNGVAIPHGTHDHIKYVNRTGIAVVQFRDGIDWDVDNKVHLIVAIAAFEDDHIGVLMNVAEIAEDLEQVMSLVRSDDKKTIIDRLSGNHDE